MQKSINEISQYLLSRNVEKADFNSYGSRRGHDEVMVRGTFANVRIKNALADKEGGAIPNIFQQSKK